ncbi:Glu-tRNA(Gln) amidotransferase subunit GatE [Candidatus Pacearchaeota archaeon]|nr:Glu-tRNA(Gln) amidotransferase subunit GatE [Candidatus Pacearchaeota archaeon]
MPESLNYSKLGFKSGLEIHQQLDTHKLFCNCPSLLRKDEPNLEVRRKLHAVAGEEGKVDAAAAHEAGLDKEFIYQSYDTTCLVELDEEPPYEINKEALMTALHISLLLNAKILSLSQIMRKTVINGSNTSGFQRTVMIARDGFVESSFGRVGIGGIFLEEDSARTIATDKNKIIYRLDRLGIPLVEIATAPDIKTPQQGKEVALKIGDILRSCKVKRGLGTIRQDINLSIRGGNRVELKGFQDPDLMIKAYDNEIKRHLSFLEKDDKNPAEVRDVMDDGTSKFLRPMPGADRMYPETDLPLLKISRDFINDAKKTLPKLREEIEKELRKEGLEEQYINLLFKQGKVSLYRELYYLLPKSNSIARTILLLPKEIAAKKKRKLEEIEEILEDHYQDVFDLLVKRKIKEDQIKNVLEALADGKSLQEAINFEEVDISEIEEKIHKLIKEKPGLNENAYMGLVMKELRGKISGSEAMEIIKRLMK